MRYFCGILIVVMLCMAAAACGPAATPAGTATPAPSPTSDWAAGLRYPRLARGVNLPGWFWYGPQGDEAIRARFDDREFRALRELGFTFVRLPIDLGFLLDPASPNLLNAHNAGLLDEAIQRLIAADLAVIVDLHSTSLSDSDEANYSKSLENAEFADTFLRWWEFFAAHLSQYDPQMLVLGPMNEPVFQENTAVWNRMQVKLIKAIRAKAPDHTIVAVGAKWSSLDSLTALTPLEDANLIYDFHFYEPFPFTHQGATWSSAAVIPLRSVPYPSSPEGVKPLVSALTDTASKQMLTQYGYEYWDSKVVRQRLQRAADWAQKNQVAVMCGEFGVLRDYAPPGDRAQWIEDTRTALESFGIGWAMWDYDSNFGLAVRKGDAATLDPAIVRALGR